ncbi:hypothetical protein [Vreelandella populi]|uniref:Uncharacterized protein n=1 Tax=Vreelandella populi TaxID=2498858 RepID=A0A3S0WNC2_9GAMM|nr:hypothetical protein [Halomonas populi]RUR46239.1 hypothetical protein ELY37_09625 [Halomonas populi]
MNNQELKRKIFRLHRNYSISILVAIIVILLSIHATDAPKLYENISFASTMSSLILSIIAIIYALQTSGTLASSLNKIQKISTRLNKTSIKIEKSNINLSKKIDLIPSEFAFLKEKIDNSHKVLENLNFNDKNDKDESIDSNYELPETLIEAYVERANRSLLDILMLFTLVHKKKSNVKINDMIFSSDSDLITGLAIGVLQTIISLKLIKYKKTTSKDNEVYIKLVEMNESLKDLVERKYAETYSTDRDEDTEDKEDTGFNLPLDYDGRIRKLNEIIHEYSL